MSLRGAAADVARNQSRTGARIGNGLAALVFAVFVLTLYWPVVRTVHLYRADLEYRGEWIGNSERRITGVTPGGPADRAGLRAGDVLHFDPARNDDWVLAGYRPMPAGFRASLPVVRADGRREVATLAPERVAFLPTMNDRIALWVRMISCTVFTLIAVLMVWLRPGVMTWSLMMWSVSGNPSIIFVHYFLAFQSSGGFESLAFVTPISLSMIAWIVPFAIAFPGNQAMRWAWWQWLMGLTLFSVFAVYLSSGMSITPFERTRFPEAVVLTWAGVTVLCLGAAAAVFVMRYRSSDESSRARLRWGLLGMSFAFLLYVLWSVQFVTRFAVSDSLTANQLTPGQWIFAFASLFVFPLAFGYGVLRERVVDVQFALSRTVVYGIVSTLVLVFLAVLHWLLGRMIEHSRLAFGLEGLAAVALGLVLHRASHGINTGVDRVLFRKHHAAEQRLRQVTAALPFATTERSIAESIVIEPTRNLELASAALFYRETTEGPLRRVLAEGWDGSYASELDADSLLVRYLQAEHRALKLDVGQPWLPDGMPEGAAHPVLAIPIVMQHALTAVVLYGAHVNSTLPDPDELELLEALAKAAATSHQQVRVELLRRENAELQRENKQEKACNEQLRALAARALGDAASARS